MLYKIGFKSILIRKAIFFRDQAHNIKVHSNQRIGERFYLPSDESVSKEKKNHFIIKITCFLRFVKAKGKRVIKNP